MLMRLNGKYVLCMQPIYYDWFKSRWLKPVFTLFTITITLFVCSMVTPNMLQTTSKIRNELQISKTTPKTLRGIWVITPLLFDMVLYLLSSLIYALMQIVGKRHPLI